VSRGERERPGCAFAVEPHVPLDFRLAQGLSRPVRAVVHGTDGSAVPPFVSEDAVIGEHVSVFVQAQGCVGASVAGSVGDVSFGLDVFEPDVCAVHSPDAESVPLGVEPVFGSVLFLAHAYVLLPLTPPLLVPAPHSFGIAPQNVFIVEAAAERDPAVRLVVEVADAQLAEQEQIAFGLGFDGSEEESFDPVLVHAHGVRFEPPTCGSELVFVLLVEAVSSFSQGRGVFQCFVGIDRHFAQEALGVVPLTAVKPVEPVLLAGVLASLSHGSHQLLGRHVLPPS